MSTPNLVPLVETLAQEAARLRQEVRELRAELDRWQAACGFRGFALEPDDTPKTCVTCGAHTHEECSPEPAP